MSINGSVNYFISTYHASEKDCFQMAVWLHALNIHEIVLERIQVFVEECTIPRELFLIKNNAGANCATYKGLPTNTLSVDPKVNQIVELMVDKWLFKNSTAGLDKTWVLND